MEKSRAWIELDMKHLAHNVAEFKRMLPEDCKMMPAVKANAYGHGASEMAGELQKLGIDAFCVASMEEGIELRRDGIKGEILVLGYTDPAAAKTLLDYQITQTIIDEEYGKQLESYAAKEGGRLPVHIGVDTGMHRLGIPWDAHERLCAMWKLPHLEVRGVYSHLCVSDGEEEKEIAFTKTQIARFNETVAYLRTQIKKPFAAHLQGSYGVLNYPECHYDYARVGIALYGILSSRTLIPKSAKGLLPVLSLHSVITSIRELNPGEGVGYGLDFVATKKSRIAAVAIGYADGIPRNLSGRGMALLHGKRVPIVGRVCMDQLLLDVTGVPDAAPEDEVLFIGGQGAEKISAEEFAGWSDTISNEIVSRLGARLGRFVSEN